MSSLSAPPRPTERRLQIPAQVAAMLNLAMDAQARGNTAVALEAAAAAAVADIQHHAMTMLGGSAGAALLAELYDRILEGSGLPSMAPPVAPRGRRLRVVYIVPSIASGQAASDRLVNVIERHDREAVEPFVICADEFTERVPARRWLHWPNHPSAQQSPRLFERLERSGCPVHALNPLGTDLDGALEGIAIGRSIEPDVAVFVASPACPIQAAMAWARIAPVQINQNIGSPLLVRGMDAVLYRSQRRAQEDRWALERQQTLGVFLPAAGIDTRAVRESAPVSRESLGIPTGVVVLITVGNKIPERAVTGAFAADLADFLASHPQVWWMPVGRGGYGAVMETLRDRGVSHRVVVAGPQLDVRPFLRAADIYVNEYPEGGSNSVMEAMAAGLPVAALDAGGGHCESIGAQVVGDDAVLGGNTAGYWKLVSGWCDDATKRRQAGNRNAAQAEARFGFDSLCRDYERIYGELVDRASPAS